MSKPLIVMGDKTSHGGSVVEGAPTVTTHGKPIARIGDKVTCPKCGPTTIATGDSTMLVMGKPAARHGDKTACGATLIAGQSATVVGAGSGGGGTGSPATLAAIPTRATTNAANDSQRATDTAPQTGSSTAEHNEGSVEEGPDNSDDVDHGEPSGRQWVSRFATSQSTDDLIEPFATHVESFITALRNGGANVSISATYRPPERAYLMYWAYKIAHGTDPTSVPAKEGVDIDWAHYDNDGHPDKVAAKKAATEMVKGYNIAFAPASPDKRSRHTDKRAIDMTITGYTGKTFVDGDGESVRVTNSTELYALGKTYGVIKLVQDAPHWSDDGH